MTLYFLVALRECSIFSCFLFVSVIYFNGCPGAISQDRFNFTSAIEAGELQKDGWRNRATPKRTLAVLKGLFKVLGGLTLAEIADV